MHLFLFYSEGPLICLYFYNFLYSNATVFVKQCAGWYYETYVKLWFFLTTNTLKPKTNCGNHFSPVTLNFLRSKSKLGVRTVAGRGGRAGARPGGCRQRRQIAGEAQPIAGPARLAAGRAHVCGIDGANTGHVSQRIHAVRGQYGGTNFFATFARRESLQLINFGSVFVAQVN